MANSPIFVLLFLMYLLTTPLRTKEAFVLLILNSNLYSPLPAPHFIYLFLHEMGISIFNSLVIIAEGVCRGVKWWVRSYDDTSCIIAVALSLHRHPLFHACIVLAQEKKTSIWSLLGVRTGERVHLMAFATQQ